MEIVKEHFEAEAKEYDDIILKLIPYYKQMVEALISAIPFNIDEPIQVIDLGCGTGTISKQIADKYPNAKILCVDIAANMIEIAKFKLSNHAHSEFITGDFSTIELTGKYDVVVSSLALHHLETDDKKKTFYQKIYGLLSNSGVFYNADVVLASSTYLQNVNMSYWINYMKRSVSEAEIRDNWIPKYETEDRPAKLMNQLKWLEEIGFSSVDVIWKYYNFAVYGGVK